MFLGLVNVLLLLRYTLEAVSSVNTIHKYKPSNASTTTTKIKLLKKDKDLLRDFFTEIIEKSKQQFIVNFISSSMKIEEEYLIVGPIKKRAKLLFD